MVYYNRSVKGNKLDDNSGWLGQEDHFDPRDPEWCPELEEGGITEDGLSEDGMTDVEADADTLKSAGYGTDEDYRGYEYTDGFGDE